MTMIEKWLPIKGFEGRYEVSNFGNVKSIERMATHNVAEKILIRERILKPSYQRGNRKRVFLSREHERFTLLIHRLVAIAFIPNPENKPDINHKNGNPSDNFVDNLEWVTHKENMNHAQINGLLRKKLTPDNVRDIRKRLSDGEKPTEICKIFGVNKEIIYKIKYRQSWKLIKD